MTTYDGIARGNIIEFNEPLPFHDQPVRVLIEALPQQAVSASTAVLQAARRPPRLPPQDVDELEREIASASLPVRTEELFDASGDS